MWLTGRQQSQRSEPASTWSRALVAAAEAVVTVAVANMAESVRLQTVDRGHDPRELTLIAFGGAGPLHATLLAEACAITEVVIPREPGTFSALGMVVADRAVASQSSYLAALADVEAAELARRYAALEQEARAMLGAPEQEDSVRIRRGAAMRYALQEWELRVDLPQAEIDASALPNLEAAFHNTHRARYGFAREEKPVELVTLYLDAARPAPWADYAAPPAHKVEPGAAPSERRAVHVGNGLGAVGTPVYARSNLASGAALRGPCVVQDRTATTFLHTGWSAVVDGAGNLIAELEVARS